MTPISALDYIKSLIANTSTLPDALLTFIQFYMDTDIEGCPKDSDGDMLLFEYGGSYPWINSVVIGLTRQFSFEDEDGEYIGMQQLRMGFNYLNLAQISDSSITSQERSKGSDESSS